MKNKRPSSIFSFETLQLNRALPKTLLLCLLLLSLVEVSVARQDWVWTASPHSAGGVFEAIETQVIAPATTPSVLVMGSSRIRDAVDPVVLEDALQLPEGSVLNIALTSGRAFDAIQLYQRHRQKLSQANIALIEIAEFQFNLHTPPNERERRFATFNQRLTLYDHKHSMDMTLGWFWRTYDARIPIKRWLQNIGKTPKPLTLGPDRRLQWRGNVLEEGPLTPPDKDQIDTFYEPFTINDARFDVLLQLIAMLKDDGLQVILVQTPFRDAAMDTIDLKHDDAHQHIQKRFHAISDTPLLSWRRASEADLLPYDYYDYGHMTLTGSRHFTRTLATEITGAITTPPSP